MVQFTVVGSLNYDLVSYTNRVPNAGETFSADSFETHIGGKGLNQTVSLAKLLHDEQSSVRMIGKVGDDSFGKELTGALEDLGVDTKDVEVLPGVPSGVAVIMVEKDTGENRILITAGANGHSKFNPEQLENLFPQTQKEVVVFQNEIPGTVDVISWLNKNRSSTEIVYNPSPYHTYSSALIESTDILVVNEGEALAIAKDILPIEELSAFETEIKKDSVKGYTELATNLQSKLNKDNSQTVVITLGSIGSVFVTKYGSKDFVPSVKVPKVIDTTGAGDTFLGAFITQVFTGSNTKKALEFATKASSLAIQKKGASNSIPFYKDVA